MLAGIPRSFNIVGRLDHAQKTLYIGRRWRDGGEQRVTWQAVPGSRARHA